MLTPTAPAATAGVATEPDGRPEHHRQPGRRAGRPGSTVGTALGLWGLSRCAMVLMTVVGGWMVSGARPGWPQLLARWDQWDTVHFVEVAQSGYGTDRTLPAFFPGQPWLVRALHTVVGSWTMCGLLVSLVCGAVAVVALARLAEMEAGADAGVRAVTYLLVSPFAVFLAAGYSEAPFLACALPSWLAARQGRWRAAGLLAAAACLFRVSGLFLALALAVQYAVGSARARTRPGREASWLLAPFAALVALTLFVWACTGDPMAYMHAQSIGWGRQLTMPLDSIRATWSLATDAQWPGQYAWACVAEFASAAVGVGLTGWLLARRRFGEATFVGLGVLALTTSNFYLSIGRTTLLWWPLWIALAVAGLRRPWVHLAYLWLAGPLMVAGVFAFTQGAWVN